MRKTVLFLILLSLFPTINASASDLTIEKNSAKAELTEIYKLYDEFDYSQANWDMLNEAYNNGLTSIDSAETTNLIYENLNDAAEEMISIQHKHSYITACISIENLVTFKGFIVFPQMIKIEKYQSVSRAITDTIEETVHDTRYPYYINGTIENDFELSAIYLGIPTTVDDPTELTPPTYLYAYTAKSLSEPIDKTYLKNGNYTQDSCFVYSVNNKFPNVHASAIPVIEDDVIRVQFSIYGKGADLGADTYLSETPVITSSDKSELYLKLAELNLKNDLSILLSDETNADYYNDALIVAHMPGVSQKAVDKALKKLKNIVPVTLPPKADEEPNNEAVIAPSPETSVKPIIFSDLPDDHFAKEAIDYLSSIGIFTGNPDKTFGINNNITRGEFAAILARSEEYTSTESIVFTDVSKDDWYASGVSFCYFNQITKGQTDTIFNPYAPLTRQELATMLYRFINYKKIQIDETACVPFTDFDTISDYAKPAVSYMQKTGLINGREDNVFSPADNATRSEVAKILYYIIK